jgi:hypothetical protein
VAARLRDTSGKVSAVAQMIVRIETPAPTATRAGTATATPPAEPSASATPPNAGATATPTPGATATASATAPAGPAITFFGVTRADDVLVDAIGNTDDGVPIYERLAASGFSLVVEGRPGAKGVPLGTSSLSSDVNQLPDLQIEVSRDLGNGSTTVCDDTSPKFGGVPAVTPFDFSLANAAAINDLACRFKDGEGQPVARESSDEACTCFPPELDCHFVDPASTLQFCGLIDRPLSFPSGDTRVAARIRDADGDVSTVAQLVIRIVATAVATPTAVPTKGVGPPASFADNDGCAMGSGVHGSWSGVLLAFLALALVRWGARRGVRTRRRC